MKILKKSKQEQGITLIALVVTIIVLLILAGVTVSAVMGENGLFQKASTAREINERENVKEDVTLAWGSIQMEGLPNNTSLADKAAQLETELKKKDASATVTVSTEDANVLEVSYKGYSINLNASNDTVTYIAKNGTSGGNNNNNNNNNENNNNNNNNNNDTSAGGVYSLDGTLLATISNDNTLPTTDYSGTPYHLTNGLTYVISHIDPSGEVSYYNENNENDPNNGKYLGGLVTYSKDENGDEIIITSNTVFERLKLSSVDAYDLDSYNGISDYKFVVPSNVEAISRYAFMGRNKLKYLVLPDSVKKFSWGAICIGDAEFKADEDGYVYYNGVCGEWETKDRDQEMEIEIGSSIEEYYDETDFSVRNIVDEDIGTTHINLKYINLRSVTEASWNALKASLNKSDMNGTTIKFMGTEQQFLAATGFSSLSQATTGLDSKYILEMTE